MGLTANELRIGNLYWICHEDWDEPIIATAKTISSLKDHEENPDDEKYSRGGPSDYYAPIPITEAVLAELGWCYYNGRTRGDMTMDTPCKLDIDWVGGKMQIKGHYEPGETYRPLPIQFVHQLQNLYYALTNEELTVRLEKIKVSLDEPPNEEQNSGQLPKSDCYGAVCELHDWKGGDETNLCDCGKGDGTCKREQTAP